MARPGVYKWDVEKARNALLAQGKHPSIDAVRMALGNTGSRSTIHRCLKEIEADDASSPGGVVAVSDALQTLVAQLAERLHGEADARIAAAKLEHDATLATQREAHASLQRERAIVVGCLFVEGSRLGSCNALCGGDRATSSPRCTRGS